MKSDRQGDKRILCTKESLGLEAVRRAPAESRGVAMGTYNGFLDLTLGFGSPALGWLGGAAGLGSIFIGSAGRGIAGSSSPWATDSSD